MTFLIRFFVMLVGATAFAVILDFCIIFSEWLFGVTATIVGLGVVSLVLIGVLAANPLVHRGQ